MALMERVATLLRANLNDMIDRAEDPEKMLKQLLMDMENQSIQLKTQVAIAIADRHTLEHKEKAEREQAASWRQKAELAVAHSNEEMARAALGRALQHEGFAVDLAAELEEHKDHAEALRQSYNELQGKLKTTLAQSVLLKAQMKRAQVAGKAMTAREAAQQVAFTIKTGPALERLRERIHYEQGHANARMTLLKGETLEDDFAKLERDDKVEKLLKELKQKQPRVLEAG